MCCVCNEFWYISPQSVNDCIHTVSIQYICPIKQPSLHHSIFPLNYERERTGDLSHSLAKGPGQTMCSVMNALTSVQLSMAQYVAVFTCESKYRFDKQTSHPFTT